MREKLKDVVKTNTDYKCLCSIVGVLEELRSESPGFMGDAAMLGREIRARAGIPAARWFDGKLDFTAEIMALTSEKLGDFKSNPAPTVSAKKKEAPDPPKKHISKAVKKGGGSAHRRK